MLEIKNLNKRYNDNVVLNIDSLKFQKDIFHVVVGANGSGKTTLLRLVSGLDKNYTGSIENIYKQPEIVMCFQKPYMFLGSVQENVEYGLKVRKTDFSSSMVEDLMKELGILHLSKRSACTLSAGEIQKVSLARALVLKPKLLLLDEPFANIDPESRERIENLVISLPAKGISVITVTHIMSEAYHLSSNIVRLEKGKAVPV